MGAMSGEGAGGFDTDPGGDDRTTHPASLQRGQEDRVVIWIKYGGTVGGRNATLWW